jgi:hypothetical protein
MDRRRAHWPEGDGHGTDDGVPGGRGNEKVTVRSSPAVASASASRRARGRWAGGAADGGHARLVVDRSWVYGDRAKRLPGSGRWLPELWETIQIPILPPRTRKF